MTTPVPDADALEQRLPVPGDPADAASAPPAVDEDVPEADAVEQAEPAVPPAVPDPLDPPLEADPADALEQALPVPLDEDEAREE